MATPRAAAKRSGSSNGKWLFTGMDQVHATIPLEILEPVTALCEVGHTWSVVVEMRGTFELVTYPSSHVRTQRHALRPGLDTSELKLDRNRRDCGEDGLTRTS